MGRGSHKRYRGFGGRVCVCEEGLGGGGGCVSGKVSNAYIMHGFQAHVFQCEAASWSLQRMMTQIKANPKLCK